MNWKSTNSPALAADKADDQESPGTAGQLRRQAFLVLGMHRSGTSAMTGVLARLGISPPRTLMAATPENPKGYWESQALMQYHNRLLADAGSHWADAKALNANWFRSESARHYKKELKAIIKQEFGGADQFVVKDPRICRFIPFWLDALRELSIEPRIVIVLRNPLEVAASLQSRDGFSVEKAQLLWLRHMLDAEYATRHLSRAIVPYQALIEDWRDTVARIGSELDMPLADLAEQNAAEVETFLARDLRHHKASENELNSRSDVFRWTREAYTALTELTDGSAERVPDSLSALTGVREELDRVSASLNDGVREEIQTRRLRKAPGNRPDRDLQKQLDQERRERRMIKRLLDARQRELTDVYHSNSWRLTRPLRLSARSLRWGLRFMRKSISPASWKQSSDKNGGKKPRPGLGVLNLRGRSIDYLKWIERNDHLDERDRLLICQHINEMKSAPRISILLPVSGTSLPVLRGSIESVINQLYHEWELWLIVGDDVEGPLLSLLEEYAGEDSRIRIRTGHAGDTGAVVNQPIAQTISQTLLKASGQWLMFLENGDRLSPHALYLFAERAGNRPNAAIIYADEDRMDRNGNRSAPFFKPDWDYDLFLGKNYLQRSAVLRIDHVRAAGERQPLPEAVDRRAMVLRILEKCRTEDILHIPFVLYHQSAEKRSRNGDEHVGAELAAGLVNEHFRRSGQAASAEPLGRGTDLAIRRELPLDPPLVSIVIPTRDQYELLRPCVEGILNRSDYEPLELIIVDNGTVEAEALAYLAEVGKRDNVCVIRDDGPFNFSRLVNRGVAESSGEVCVLLNNDVDIINRDWLCELVSHAIRPDVGVVGAKLYYANDTLQHGGVIVGLGGIASHAHKKMPRGEAGYFNRLNLTHQLSSVTGACLAARREVFDQVKGFDAKNLAVSLNDVDFCLKVDRAGYKVIWTPNAELYHYESVSRGGPRATPEKAARHDRERAYFRKHWIGKMRQDPFYNPNFSFHAPGFELAEYPAIIKPWIQSSRKTET